MPSPASVISVFARPPPWKPEAAPRDGNSHAGAVLLASPERVRTSTGTATSGHLFRTCHDLFAYV